MKKILKYVVGTLLVLALLLALTTLCLVTFMSPNRFKPMLAEQVLKHTGCELVIDGEVSWTLFPYFGIKVGHMVLSNPAGFTQKTFAEISQARLGVKLLPLLHKKIESSGITLQGLKLNLVKNAAGKANWDFKTETATSTPIATTNYAAASAAKTSMALAISGVDIENAQVTWTNEQTHQAFKIDKFALHADDVNMVEPFAIISSFNFSAQNPVMFGHASLTSKISLNMQKQIYSLRDLDLTVDVTKDQNHAKLTVTGEVIADLAQDVLQWTDFKGQAGNLILAGKINIANLTNSPKITGHIQMQPFDLKQWLKSIGQDVSNIQSLNNAGGSFDFTVINSVVNLSGTMKLASAQVNKVQLSNINIPMSYQGNVLQFSPITASFYQGTLESQVKADLNGAVPQMAVQGKMNNIAMGGLLQDLAGDKQKLTFTGTGQMTFAITTAGKTGDAIVKNLNGTSQFGFNHGEVQGLDIGYLIDTANAFVSKVATPGTDTNKTDFGNMSGTAAIRNGVITNNDLLMDSTRFDTKGKGSIDLVNQRIDYALETELKQSTLSKHNDLFNLYGLPIPIRIVGNLKNPSVNIDTSVLAKAIAQKQIKNAATKVQDKVQEEIKKQLPGDAGKMLQNLLGQ
jgi:AsmA protein